MMVLPPAKLRPTKHRITRKEFAKAVSEGLTIGDVVVKFNCTPQTVRNWEYRFGLRCRRKREAKPLDEGTLKKLVAEGLNSAEIAKKLKAPRNTVYWYLRKYGITYNPDRVGGLKLPKVNLAKFTEKVLGKYGDATVRKNGKVVMRDGKLIGEEGKRWLEEKVKTAFPRRGKVDD